MCNFYTEIYFKTNIFGSGLIKQPIYYYVWRRTYWENALDDIDARIRAVVSPSVRRV